MELAVPHGTGAREADAWAPTILIRVQYLNEGLVETGKRDNRTRSCLFSAIFQSSIRRWRSIRARDGCCPGA